MEEFWGLRDPYQRNSDPTCPTRVCTSLTIVPPSPTERCIRVERNGSSPQQNDSWGNMRRVGESDYRRGVGRGRKTERKDAPGRSLPDGGSEGRGTGSW